MPGVQPARPADVGFGPASPARYTIVGSWTVPILNETVLETLMKRILKRTVTRAVRSCLPEPIASALAVKPMPANEMPNSRASTFASSST